MNFFIKKLPFVNSMLMQIHQAKHSRKYLVRKVTS
jgi:hypothetical protein